MFLEAPRFPDDIAQGARSVPSYRTEITELEGGTERRNALWSLPRHRYDVSYGVRGITDLEALAAFFHAVRGSAYPFRFKDWSDFASCGVLSAPTAMDQVLATADGVETDFPLVKRYSAGALETVRPIAKPVDGSVLVALDGVPQASGWQCDAAAGVVVFDAAPADGVAVSAGFYFDVPVRFDSDELPLALICYEVGSVSVVLVEVRGE